MFMFWFRSGSGFLFPSQPSPSPPPYLLSQRSQETRQRNGRTEILFTTEGSLPSSRTANASVDLLSTTPAMFRHHLMSCSRYSVRAGKENRPASGKPGGQKGLPVAGRSNCQSMSSAAFQFIEREHYDTPQLGVKKLFSTRAGAPTKDAAHPKQEPEIIPAPIIVGGIHGCAITEQRHNEGDARNTAMPQPIPEPDRLHTGSGGTVNLVGAATKQKQGCD